jgi:hypothetical protein
VIGEAAVRDWLVSFLPKRFGVVSGFIKSQNPTSKMSSHFDVLIFDQVESPILWVDANPDKSTDRQSRVIPAEFVLGVIEVKSAFNKKTVQQGIDKLNELMPLMAKQNPIDDRYPRFLPSSTVLSMLFFELRASDAMDYSPLELIRDFRVPRSFLGPVILRCESFSEHATGLVDRLPLPSEIATTWKDGGMLQNLISPPSSRQSASDDRLMLAWFDLHFSRYAFDLLAHLKGSYLKNYASSFYGYDTRGIVG